MAKTYVLSDVHIGNDTPTCWYQKSYHEPYLIAVLDEIIKNKDKTDENKIDEVLLLGDLFDFWTYAPDDNIPSIEQILEANPYIFAEKVKFPDGTEAPGKLIQVIEALPGKVKYLRGNHDINITQADLDKLPGKNKIQLVSDMYVKDDVLYMHGNLPTIFNAPDVTVQAQKIAVGQNEDGRLEVFYVAKDKKNSIYHMWQVSGGAWTDPEPFGGQAHELAVGPNADGRQEVFYMGLTEQPVDQKKPNENKSNIYHCWQTAPNNGWSAHLPFGGQAQRGLAMGRNADGRLEVFHIGTDNKIYYASQTAPNNGWSGYTSLGYVAASLAVGQNTDGRLEVFYVGTISGDKGQETNIHSVSQKEKNKNDWSESKTLGGLAKSLSVGQNADGSLEVFYVDMGNQNSLYHIRQNAKKNGWLKPEPFGGEAKSIGVGRDTNGCLHLFYVGNDDHIYHVWQTAPNNGWSAHVRVTSIPVGHFVTRSIMYRLKKDFAKGGKSAGKTAADLAGQGSPASSDLLDLNKLKGSDSLTSILLNAFGGWAQFARDEDKRVKLFNGQQKSVDQAKVDYANLDSLWVSRFGGGEYAKSTVWKSVIADATGDFLGWFAQKSALEQGAKLVVMGHTHVPQLGLVVQAGQGQAAVNYINSGFMCPAKPDVGKKKNPARFTFAMIDRKPGKDSTPELHQVNNNYLVEKTSAPPAVITYTPLPGGDFSCYVWVENNTGKELQRLKMEAGQGAFVVNPPEKIGIGQTVGFWIQDYLGFGGSQGAVVYQTLNKRAPQLFLLQFACPTGFGNNFCSGLGTTFETKSGSGDWQNKVVEKDHPFFVRFHIK